MEDAFGNVGVLDRIHGVVGIGIQGLVGHDVIREKSFQVLLTIAAEEEAIDLGSEFLEGEVGRSEDGSTNVCRCVIDDWDQSGLGETELQGTEFSREELDYVDDVRGWYKQAVDTVDDSVCSELLIVRYRTLGQWFTVTYDVNGDDAGIKVDGQTLQANVGADPLRSDANSINGQGSRYGVGDQDLAGWVELW